MRNRAIPIPSELRKIGRKAGNRDAECQPITQFGWFDFTINGCLKTNTSVIISD